jgi:hypothetical protein
MLAHLFNLGCGNRTFWPNYYTCSMLGVVIGQVDRRKVIYNCEYKLIVWRIRVINLAWICVCFTWRYLVTHVAAHCDICCSYSQWHCGMCCDICCSYSQRHMWHMLPLQPVTLWHMLQLPCDICCSYSQLLLQLQPVTLTNVLLFSNLHDQLLRTALRVRAW